MFKLKNKFFQQVLEKRSSTCHAFIATQTSRNQIILQLLMSIQNLPIIAR